MCSRTGFVETKGRPYLILSGKLELFGILGQRDNSIIKKKISPVPLPEKVVKQMGKPVDPEYIKGDGAYYLQYCYGYQWETNGVVKSTLRHKIHIVNSTGANDFSTYSIDFNPLYEQLHINNFLFSVISCCKLLLNSCRTTTTT